MSKFDTGTILKNTNGAEYIVLHDCGEYTLLKQMNYDQFVVAWNIQHPDVNKDEICWDAGHYFRPDHNDLTVRDALDDCIQRAFKCLFEKQNG